MRLYKLLPVLAFVFFSCAENEKQEKSANVGAINESVSADTTESFEMFNERFHRDSAFQLSRIAFPIGGHFAEGENSHEWTAKNWELLKEPVREVPNTEEYEHDLQKTDTTVIEKYWIENSDFKVDRRFKKIGSKWFLTYYDDINL